MVDLEKFGVVMFVFVEIMLMKILVDIFVEFFVVVKLYDDI